MKRRAFMGLGVTSVGVGALYGTGAFSSVSAGRGVSINAADDLNALFKIDDEEEGSSREPIFTNKSSLFMHVSIEEKETDLIFRTDESESEGSVDFNLPESDTSQSVEIEAEESGTVEVNISVELRESESGLNKGHIALVRDFTATQSEQVEISGEVTTTGGSGDLTFTLENEGNIGVTLNQIGIRPPTDESIGPVDDGELLGTPGSGRNVEQRVVDEAANEIPIDETTFVDFQDLEILELDVGDEISLKFDRFSDDPRGTNITLELTFKDQSSVRFEVSSS